MFADLVEQYQTLNDTQLTATFRALELEQRTLAARRAALLAVVEQRGAWTQDGHLSPKRWMRANTNWSNEQAIRARREALLVNQHPVVGDALAAGHIGLAQLDELARAASNRRCGDQVGDVIDLLVDNAEQLPFEDFRTVVRRWEHLADADGAHHTAEQTHEHRTATLHELDGGIYLRATGGSPLTTARLQSIFEQYLQAEFRADVATRTAEHGPDAPASRLARTDTQRRFDALVRIFDDAAARPADAERPMVEPTVHIIADAATFERLLAHHALTPDPGDQPGIDTVDLAVTRCETNTGIPVAGCDVMRAALAGHVRRVVLDSAGVIIDYGRRKRLFTGQARIAARLLAQHCDSLGCTVPASRCQIDHLQAFARDLGATDLANAGPRCSGDNRRKHRLRFTSKRDGNGRVVDYRADGTPILPVGRRLVPATETEPASQPNTRGRPRRRTQGDIIPDLLHRCPHCTDDHSIPVHRLRYIAA